MKGLVLLVVYSFFRNVFFEPYVLSSHWYTAVWMIGLTLILGICNLEERDT